MRVCPSQEALRKILIQLFLLLTRYLRSYLGERIRTHQNSEIKLLQAAVVMYWVTLREVAVMKVFFLNFFAPRQTGMLFFLFPDQREDILRWPRNLELRLARPRPG